MQGRTLDLATIVCNRLARESATNPLIGCAVASNLASADQVEALFYGQEINVKTTELIINAQQEVLMQFYNFDAESNSGEDILAALVTLNSSAQAQNRSICIRLIVNMRQGPASFFTSKTANPFTWLQQDDEGNKFIALKDQKYYLKNLDIQTKLHTHYFFDAYHTKEIIIDKKYLMLRSGDIYKHANSRDRYRRRIDMATCIMNEQIASVAADSFYARWRDEKIPQKFVDCTTDNPIPVILFEKNESTNPLKGMANQAPLKIALLEGLACAENIVKIMTPNLNDEDIVNGIIATLQRGVEVQLITGKFMNDVRESKPGMGGTNREAIYKIYQSIPVYMWDKFQVRWACDDQHELIMRDTADSFHCKVVILDDCAVITGSSPLDKQATRFSSECDALIVSPEVAKKFDSHIFAPTFKRGEDCVRHSFLQLKHLLITSIQNNFDQSQLPKASLVTIMLSRLALATNFADLAHILDMISEPPQTINSGIAEIGLFAPRAHIEKLKAVCAESDVELRKNGVFSSFSRFDDHI